MNAAHVGTLKSPPYLVHSEKAVLGAVLTDPSADCVLLDVVVPR